LGGQAAGAADTIANSVAGKQLQERGLIATPSYIIAADNNSTAAYSYTGDGIEDDFTAAELTLMGRMDAFMSLCIDDVP
jgi:hypothetical protein